MMKYKIELTAEQMRVMEKCLEEYFRLRLNQPLDFADELADMAYPLAMTQEPGHDEQFEKMMITRDHIQEVMGSVLRMAFGPRGVKEKTDDMEIAECVWDAIRFARGKSRWSQPFHIGPEPVPKIEKMEERE